MSVIWPFALLGLTTGAGYALTAAGIIAIYRGSGVLNLASGAMGMAGAYAFWAVYDGNPAGGPLPLVPSILVGVAAGVALGAVTYGIVMRRLRDQPVLTQMVATLGILLLLQGIATLHYGANPQPIPSFLGTGRIQLFDGRLQYSAVILCAFAIAVSVALWFLFSKTTLGHRAAALRDRPEAASVIGISPNPVGYTTWCLGSGLAAFAAIMLLPVTQLSPAQLTLVVLPALAVALAADFRSFGIALAVGVALGVFDSILVGENVSPNWTDAVPFLLIVGLLFVRGKSRLGRDALANKLPAVGPGTTSVPMMLIGLAFLCVIGLGLSTGWSNAMTSSLIFAIFGLSVLVVTGWTGQLSLAPMALAGLGSLFAARAAAYWGLPFIPAALIGVLVAGLAGIVVGIPAVRVRGVSLAIVTLGMAVVVEDLIFNSTSLTGGILGITVPDPKLFGFDVSSSSHPARFAGLCIVVFVVAMLCISNLRRSSSGRQLLAVRENERAAAALGVSVSQTKLAGFAISAALAGVAGVLITFQDGTVLYSGNFDVAASITLLGFVIFGGVGYPSGAVMAGLGAAGGVFSQLLSNAVAIDKYLPTASGLFIVLVLLQHPDGAAPLMRRQRDDLIHTVRRWFGRRAGDTPPAVVSTPTDISLTVPPAGDEAPGVDEREDGIGAVMLESSDIRVQFGETVAVDGVSITLRSGELVGLIGPNGAGKTTLIDAITGFEGVAHGRVLFDGEDVTRMRPDKRARLGLVRNFQTLELFEGLTVQENVLCALDDRRRYRWLSDLVAPRWRRVSRQARAELETFGLAGLANRKVSDLPQGLRRETAIARAALMRPKVLCLDEPVAGLTMLEKQAVGRLIRTFVRRTNAAVLLVEHDLDVVQDLCDEIVVLEAGRVIARGTPETVMQHEEVRRAYIGVHRTAEVA